MFKRAVRDRPSDASDLVPYWVYSVDGGAHIERHVPHLPLSREAVRLEALRRSLAIYRMVFGQPRQEDLMAFLLDRYSPEEAEKFAARLRVDLSPGRSMGAAVPPAPSATNPQ